MAGLIDWLMNLITGLLQAMGVQISYEDFNMILQLLNSIYNALPSWLQPIFQAIVKPLLDLLMSMAG